MSPNPLLVPAKPTHITLDTLPQLFAHWRGVAGGMSMTQTGNEPETGPDKPDGITDDEWTALGDPGRAALVREREARQAAERAVAASRARPAPPKKTTEPPKAADTTDEPKGGTDPAGVDFKALIKEAVSEAVRPFQEKEEQREADDAAKKVVDSVLTAAKQTFEDRQFHDPSNALSLIDLTTVLDGNGAPDDTKIKAALGDLLKRQPHLGKVVDTRRQAAPGTGAGAGGASIPLDDRVKNTLARMQASAGIKPST